MADDVNIANMVATVDFKVNKTEYNKVLSKFMSLKKALLAAAVGLFLFERHLGKMGTQLSNTSQILQVPTDQLQAMKVAAREASIPFSALTGALGTLQSALAGIKAGKGIPENMQKALGNLAQKTGIALNPATFKNSYDGLKKIANALKLVPTTQGKEGILNTLFSNSTLLPLVSNGMDKINQAYKKLKAEGAFLSPQDIKDMHTFNVELVNAEQQFEVMAAKMGVKLMPAFESLFQGMVKIAQNKDFVEGLKVILHIFEDIAKVMLGLVRMLGQLRHIGRDLKGTGSMIEKGAKLGLEKVNPIPRISSVLHEIGHHMTVAVASAQQNAGIIPRGGSSVSNQTNNNNNSNTTNNHTTVVNTHNHLEMMSSHVTGRFQ